MLNTVPDFASQSNSAPQALVQYGKQLAVACIGCICLGRLLNGSDAGRIVVLRRISKQWLTVKDAEWVSNAVAAYTKVRHPSLLKLLGVLECGDDLVSVSEHMEGVRLTDLERSVFDEGVPIPATVAVRIVLDAARATWKAHRLATEVGIFPTERLFLPEGVLVAGYGGTLLTEVGVLSALARCVVPRTVADLLAQLAPEELSSNHIQVGSPEVFSLGVVLWELLANRWLFGRESDSRTHQELLLSRIPGLDQIERFGMPVPSAIVNLVRKATERDPSKRFASVNDLVLALEGLPAHFIATEYQVAEVLRQRAGAMLKESRAEEAERGRSGTFAEVRSSPTSVAPPNPANSVAPPSASNHDWDRPTLAQSSLVSQPPFVSSVVALSSTTTPSMIIITEPDRATAPPKLRRRRTGMLAITLTALIAVGAGAAVLRGRLPQLPRSLLSPAPAARVAPLPERAAVRPAAVEIPTPVQPAATPPEPAATPIAEQAPVAVEVSPPVQPLATPPKPAAAPIADQAPAEPASPSTEPAAAKAEPEPTSEPASEPERTKVVTAKIAPAPKHMSVRKAKAPRSAKTAHDGSDPAPNLDPQWGI